MLTRSARLYDALNDAAGKDYAVEAAAVLGRVSELHPGARSLLDVACGTGRHIEHFLGTMSCTGVDLEPALLQLAAVRCPPARFLVGDLTDLDLGERFDVVTCLFSGIAYVRTRHGLDVAVAGLARHLRPGGVLVVEPFLAPEAWHDGEVVTVFVDRPDLKLARIGVCGRDDAGVATFDCHYVVGEGGRVDHFSEHHELGLFALQDYLQAFEAAGVQATVDLAGPSGRGLVVGQRPAGPLGGP
jgi:SAM-dependent methyltransferase